MPDDPIILEHVGDAYLKLDQKDKALEFYRRALLKKNEDKEPLEEKIRSLSENMRQGRRSDDLRHPASAGRAV